MFCLLGPGARSNKLSDTIAGFGWTALLAGTVLLTLLNCTWLFGIWVIELNGEELELKGEEWFEVLFGWGKGVIWLKEDDGLF